MPAEATGLRALPKGVCIACDEILPENFRCVAESHKDIVGRSGRHRGGCWGGRFPTSDEHNDWREKLKRYAEKRRERAAAREAEILAAEDAKRAHTQTSMEVD